MARVNVNTATREDLVNVAGLRPDLADEILEFRRRGKITSVEALGEVPGLGPATLDQLRKSLDFRVQSGNGDDRGEGGHGGKHAIDKSAGVARDAADLAVKLTREVTDETGNVAHHGLQVAQTVVASMGELQREVAQRSAEQAAGLGRALLAVAHEQTQHNANLLNALTEAVDWTKASKAVDWDKLVQLQSEFLRVSLERSAQLTQHWLEVTQAVMAASASAARQQARKAA
jgi:Helix-hairpin-helix motif